MEAQPTSAAWGSPSLPGPGSVTWEYAGDIRVLAAAGYALLLQVAHPTVAAGVREHSDYASDPWGRLLRTLDYANLMVYGGHDAATAAAERLRETHKQFRGTRPDGRPYTALEPEAFAWVHGTLVEAIVAAHARFGRRLDADQVEQLYGEWRASGRLIGVREGDMPPSWRGFRAYFERMLERRLEDNDVVQGVLESLARPAAPPISLRAGGIPLPLLAGWAWRLGRIPVARLTLLVTVGLLPPLLRDRFGLEWSIAQELQLRAMGTGLRLLTPIMPGYLRNTGPGYIRWRREAIAERYPQLRWPGTSRAH